MDKTSFETYIKDRYEKQTDYYSNASLKYQKKYKQFQWVLIILSALTPVIAALNGITVSFRSGDKPFQLNLSLVVVIISSIVAILTTGLKTFNYQELWIINRSTSEKLKPEIYYYNFNVGEYGKPGIDKETLFVLRVEALLDIEHVQWPPAKKLQDDHSDANFNVKPKDSALNDNNKETSA